MKRPHLVLATAWLVHVAAWLLPVVKGGVQLPEGVPGWQAWRTAFSVVWPYDHIAFDTWYTATLATASAITTVLFVLGSPWIILGESYSIRRLSAWLAVSAFVINLHWYILFGSDRADLRIGYFLWWLSFMILALGLFDLARLGQAGQPATSRAASTTDR